LPLAKGDKAPKITVKGELSDVTLPFPREATVLFFYPTNQGSTCITEVVDFDDRLDDFLSCGIGIAGVTTEPLSEMASLKGAKRLMLPLCSDPLGIASSLYGVRNAYGFAGRYTFLISKEGEVLQVWDAYNTAGHAEEVRGQCRRTFRR
jgi:peroxiredoxin Q/BCP